jgi:copper chaperone CopZ
MIICSVLIAIALWFFISITIYPTTPKTFTNVPIEVDLTGTSAEENGLSVISRNSKSATITIKGMQCNHCKSNVEKAIRAVEGVDNVEIDLASGIATIHGKVNITEIQKAVEAIGFECYIKKN